MTGLIERLSGFGERLAVATGTEQLTYHELATRVAAVAERLGAQRGLVMLQTRNDIGTLVHYLAALAAGHPVLPVPAGRDHTAIIDTYDPEVVIDDQGIRRRRTGSSQSLHPDLALLLSTSGSTGSPKLVRLSRSNLIANARAIARYLEIDDTDRAATTLPLSYCYGLSVVHTHLLVGAGLILTDHSVVDDEFWELFRRHHGTSFASVPYTFDLLDRIGFADMDLPDLRYITQAGGRLDPERVRRYAELGERKGWQLYVMYGATEATARMAYLPPDLAASRPSAIGRPIPGGSFRIDPIEGWDDGGELVYQGPNVMMGYAQSRADLALGSTLRELRTGDIARRGPDGLYEVIGRASRFVKLYGLRIDLQQLEARLADQGVAAQCAAGDDRVVVAYLGPSGEQDVARSTADAAGLSPASVTAVRVGTLPTTASGKPDYPAVRELARRERGPASGSTDVRDVFAGALHVDRDTVTAERSFVDLGGNSLSYVALSVRLERALGRLPADWHRKSVRELEAMARSPRRRSWWNATMETSVALRAVAIVLIVGSHAGLFEVWGGAHVLLGVAGYNFGRFCLTPAPRVERIRHLRSTIAWIAVPSIVWIALALLVTDDYHPTNLLLLQKILGPDGSMTAGRLWFIEALVWMLVALAVILWFPISDRTERRRPFAFAAVFVAAGVALRYDVLGLGLGSAAWFTVLTFWFFAAGWAAAKSSMSWQRALVTAVLAVGLFGYFDEAYRGLLVFAGLALLIWLPAIRCPAGLAVVAGLLAEASLYIYLTHYQVYALFDGHPLVGVLAALVVGVLVTKLVSALRTRFGRSPIPAEDDRAGDRVGPAAAIGGRSHT